MRRLNLLYMFIGLCLGNLRGGTQPQSHVDPFSLVPLGNARNFLAEASAQTPEKYKLAQFFHTSQPLQVTFPKTFSATDHPCNCLLSQAMDVNQYLASCLWLGLKLCLVWCVLSTKRITGHTGVVSESKMKPTWTTGDVSLEITRMLRCHWREKFKVGWMDLKKLFSPLWPKGQSPVPVWSLFWANPYFQRLASFRPAVFYESVSAVQLAAAGFSFHEGSVRCQGCDFVVPLGNFTSAPTDVKYHKSRECAFVKDSEDRFNDNRNSGNSGDVETSSTLTLTPDTLNQRTDTLATYDSAVEKPPPPSPAQTPSEAEGYSIDADETNGSSPEAPGPLRHSTEASGPETCLNEVLEAGHSKETSKTEGHPISEGHFKETSKTEGHPKEPSETGHPTSEGHFKETSETEGHPKETSAETEGHPTSETEVHSKETSAETEGHPTSETEGHPTSETEGHSKGSPETEGHSVELMEVWKDQVAVAGSSCSSSSCRNKKVVKKWEKLSSVVSAVSKFKRSRLNSGGSSSSRNDGKPSHDGSKECSQLAPPPHLGLVESKYFSQENDMVSKRKALVSALKNSCEKKKGHYAYFPIETLEMVHLPPALRTQKVFDFVMGLSKLTVRLVTKCTSSHRLLRKDKQEEKKYKVGTGMVLMDTDMEERVQSRLNSSTGMKGWRKQQQILFIRTDSHVVLDDKEAASTRVEFFYDTVDRRNVVSVKASNIFHSSVPGDHHSVLVCKNVSRDLFQKLEELKREFINLEQALPEDMKSVMTKKVLVVSHPHGAPSVLSHGESLVITYALRRGESLPWLEKQTGAVNADVRELYKAMIFTADTCSGCSGAPVIAYRAPQLTMTTWMHHGVEKEYRLGVTATQVCTEEEIEVFKQPLPPSKEPSETDQKSEDTVPNCVVYPEFVVYANRLASFNEDWNSGHIHQPILLAFAGFYFAGYSDCVRCFYCGLGLRSWNPGDNIFMEHKNNNPNCLFLHCQFRRYGEERLCAGTHPILDKTEKLQGLPLTKAAGENGGNKEISSPPKGQAMEAACGEKKQARREFLLRRALEYENVHLQEQSVCKICHQQSVKDLFLPCGHLCSCSDCCKLLSHCPVCQKQILATVDTFFT